MGSELECDSRYSIKFDKIEIVFKDVPAEINQLYHVKIVDTEWQNRKEPYSITFETKEENDIYSNVVLTTPLFTLEAPKIRLKERENRIKIIVLSRI